jgi:CheY-like chemotaxis protein
VQRKVLVAEDDLDLRTAISEYLREAGFDVVEAADGGRALEAARTEAPDVLVVDLNMPVVDGAQLLAAWMCCEALRDVPVLLVSADSEMVDVARRYAVRATLAKPFDMDVLTTIVEQLIAHPEAPSDV